MNVEENSSVIRLLQHNNFLPPAITGGLLPTNLVVDNSVKRLVIKHGTLNTWIIDATTGLSIRGYTIDARLEFPIANAQYSKRLVTTASFTYNTPLVQGWQAIELDFDNNTPVKTIGFFCQFTLDAVPANGWDVWARLSLAYEYENF